MATQMFLNLPVKDLKRSVDFFTKMGYTFNQQFTNEKATCMVISENNNYVMLLTEPFFQTFIPNKIADTNQTTECLICLSADNKEMVDELVDKAIEAGATTYKGADDHGFMYSRSFKDPDGHIWEILYMDVAAFSEMQQQTNNEVVAH